MIDTHTPVPTPPAPGRLDRFLEGSSLRGLVMLAVGLYLLLDRPDLHAVALAFLASGTLGVTVPERK